MAGLSVSVKGSASTSALGKRLAARAAKLRDANVRTMRLATEAMKRELVRNHLTGRASENPFWGKGGAAARDQLAVRTGATRRSIVARVFNRVFFVMGTVGSALRSFAVHDKGGTIRGRPWLRIPTRVMKTPAGVDRLAGRSARTLPNTFVMRSRRGNLWIAEGGTARAALAQEVNGAPLLLYLLKHQVVQRPRRMLAGTLKATLPRLRRMFRGALVATVRG